jgi:dihydrofolate reductase
MAKIYISSIVAASRNNVIGKDNALLWHVPEDLKHFKKMTFGKPMVMGRKTFESFGKPLPGRPHIVISRSHNNLLAGKPSALYKEMESGDGLATKIDEGPFLYATIEDGMAAAKDMAVKMGVNEIMIIGGGEIYKQTLPMTERLYLTVIDREYEGDTYFPGWKAHEWHTVSKEHHDGDPSFTFFVLERK